MVDSSSKGEKPISPAFNQSPFLVTFLLQLSNGFDLLTRNCKTKTPQKRRKEKVSPTPLLSFMEEKSRDVDKPTSIFGKLLMSTIEFLSSSCLFIYSSLSSNQNPLLSIIVSFHALVLLYLPHLFLPLLFSPVLIFTLIILASLLHLGAAQKTQLGKDEIFAPAIQKRDCENEDPIWAESETATEPDVNLGFVPKPDFSEAFMEWSLKGPLEVIYEEYEGEEEEDLPENLPENERRRVGIDGLGSLSFYYPDSNSSDDEFPMGLPAWDSPESLCFMWEEEREDGLIEIPLGNKRTVGFQVEEENLIEIDLSVDGK